MTNAEAIDSEWNGKITGKTNKKAKIKFIYPMIIIVIKIILDLVTKS